MKELYQIVQKLEGNIILIGIKEEKILSLIKENKKIEQCYLLNTEFPHNQNKQKMGKKNFHIKNLRKKFRKKKIDYIVCNMEEIYPYLNTFIKDSVYINRKKIYFYGETQKFELDFLIKRYQKYHAETHLYHSQKKFMLTISNEKSKTTKIKDFYFMIYDKIKWLYEIIGDILIN